VTPSEGIVLLGGSQGKVLVDIVAMEKAAVSTL
jgi:hypothetical protein